MKTEFKVTDAILASSGKRFLNYILDTFFFYLLIIGVTVIQELIDDSSLYIEEDTLSSTLFNWLFYVFMFFTLEKLTQRTIGKYITQTIVVIENGEKPTTKQLLIRSFSRLIPFEAFSFLGTHCSGWHDSISKTYVVDNKKFIEKKQSEIDFNDLGKPIEEIVF